MFEVAGLVVDVVLVTVVLPEVVDVELLVVTLVFEATVGAGDGVAGLFMLVLAGLLVALFAVPASPQAIPIALRANTDESAITFFITNSSLLSSSKNKNLTYFYCIPAHARVAPNSKIF